MSGNLAGENYRFDPVLPLIADTVIMASSNKHSLARY
jgi:hypothetical protein